MPGFKDKFQVFFIGLLLGLILGGGFFLFKLDQYVKELSIYKSFTQHKESASDNVAGKNTIPAEKNTPKPVTTVHSGTATPSSANKDTTRTGQLSNGSRKAVNDSLRNPDSVQVVNKEQEDIVLKKDELLTLRSLELMNISAVAQNTVNSRDSAAAKLAGVREDHNNGRQFCAVEFWSSPLNYKGYKMSHNKVILYGLADSENMKLFKLDDEIYLQCGAPVFHLEYTNEFRPYEKVVSESILSKLK
jgi:hypothetical protein